MLSRFASSVVCGFFTAVTIMSFAVNSQGEELRGIFAIGEGKPIPAVVLSSPWVDGIAVRYNWERLEPNEGRFNWADLDQDIAHAHQYRKTVSIGITAGIRTPIWVYQAGAAQFTYIWDRPWGPPACSQQRIPIPWDSVYLSKWKRFVDAFASRYEADKSVVYVKMTGINAGTQELILPHSRGREKNLLSVGCTTSDQTQDWQRAGYTRRKIESTWLEIADTFARVLPRKSLGLMIGPRGFPPIDENGNIIPSRGADLEMPNDLIDEGVKQVGDRFVLQNNGLSAVKAWDKLSQVSSRVVIGWQMVWSASDDPRCRMNGGLNPCDPSATLAAATDRGLDTGARFLEIYLADLLNPQLQPVLKRTHERLLRRTTTDPTNAYADMKQTPEPGETRLGFIKTH
jgi:hypothetical protein